ncbi:MAG: dihydroorotase [Flavobacteriales bacterium]|nr:dihydroorotase [Flavobacteriales bacterium]
MKPVTLRQVKVIDPGGPHHEKEIDIRIEKGTITKIAARIPKGMGEEIHVKGMHASPGWVDLRAHFRDPGEEWKQGVRNGLDAAAAGGFTRVAVLPSTDPVMDKSSGVANLLSRANGHVVQVLPVGALTQGLKGEQLAELHDLRTAGAVAYCDDQHTVRNSRLMLLALQYANGLPGIKPPIMVFPNDPDLSLNGMMHEGTMSTRLGLKGIPPMAETIQLARDLELLEYAGGHLHVATISTTGSVGMIRQAKARQLHVTASVAAHNLFLDDACLRSFETRYKVMPPLRDITHIEALRDGVKDGTIDCIVSDHRPEDREHKIIEFGPASFGIIGLETCFAVANTALKGRTTLRRIIERFTVGPRAVLGSPAIHIAEGTQAEITLFDPELEWTCAETDLVSKSHNTPFIGQRFTGRALGIIAQGQVIMRS